MSAIYYSDAVVLTRLDSTSTSHEIELTESCGLQAYRAFLYPDKGTPDFAARWQMAEMGGMARMAQVRAIWA
jgi:hypothetical protein